MLFSFHHCIVWPYSIFDFRLPLWYLPSGFYWELQWKNTICRNHNLFKFVRQSHTGNLIILTYFVLKTVRAIQHMLVYYINRINREHRNIKEKKNHQNCSRNYCVLHAWKTESARFGTLKLERFKSRILQTHTH